MNNEVLCRALRNAKAIYVEDDDGSLIEVGADVLAIVDAYSENERCIEVMMEKNEQMEFTLRQYRRKVKDFIEQRKSTGELKNLQLLTAEKYILAGIGQSHITDEMKVLQSNYNVLKAIEDLSKAVFPDFASGADWLEAGDPSPLDLLRNGELGKVLISLVNMKESKENNGG